MITLQRALLFLVGCIGTRTFFTYLAYSASPTILPLIGAVAGLPAIGFLVIWFYGLRRTGAEVGGERIWWDRLRPMHAALWGSAAALALAGRHEAWMPLAVDTLFGLGAWARHHFSASE